MQKPMTLKKKQETVEYKVIGITSSTPEEIESWLNELAVDGWRVITSIQHGARIILERDVL